MQKLWGLVILAAIGFSVQASAQNKDKECMAIADVFRVAGEGYQMSANIGDAINLTDRLLLGMKKLNLVDPKLKNLQGRYIAYFNSSNELLKKGQQNQNNEAALDALMASARASSAMGHNLGQELIDYCSQ